MQNLCYCCLSNLGLFKSISYFIENSVFEIVRNWWQVNNNNDCSSYYHKISMFVAIGDCAWISLILFIHFCRDCESTIGSWEVETGPKSTKSELSLEVAQLPSSALNDCKSKLLNYFISEQTGVNTLVQLGWNQHERNTARSWFFSLIFLLPST